jgi:hypothetical protein
MTDINWELKIAALAPSNQPILYGVHYRLTSPKVEQKGFWTPTKRGKGYRWFQWFGDRPGCERWEEFDFPLSDEFLKILKDYWRDENYQPPRSGLGRQKLCR